MIALFANNGRIDAYRKLLAGDPTAVTIAVLAVVGLFGYVGWKMWRESKKNDGGPSETGS